MYTTINYGIEAEIQLMLNTPANETADLVSLNMAVPVRTVSGMRDNPKTLNRSGVYIYNK